MWSVSARNRNTQTMDLIVRLSILFESMLVELLLLAAFQDREPNILLCVRRGVRADCIELVGKSINALSDLLEGKISYEVGN